jgi:hypothetical protein
MDLDETPLGAATANVWTRQQALHRHSSTAVAAFVARGLWQSLWPGVYADAGHAPDALQRGWAAVLAGGDGAVACGRTAARLWGLPLVDDDDPTVGATDRLHHDVAVLRNPSAVLLRGPDGARLHRRQLRLADDEVVLHVGPPTTSVARTLRDLGALLTHEALVCAFDDALGRELITPDDVTELLRRAKGSRQIRRLSLAAELADPGAATPAETLARLLLKPLVPGLRCQVPVHEPWGELIAVLDLADEELLLAVEVDGKRGHAGTQMVAKDRRRDRRTAGRGWHTERVTWFELRRQQHQVRRRVEQEAIRLAASRRLRPTA